MGLSSTAGTPPDRRPAHDQWLVPRLSPDLLDPINPSTDPRIIFVPAADDDADARPALRERHRLRSYYYGNFNGTPARPGQPDTRTWRAFTHQPRIGQNYVGLRNRLAILSEAYSYLDFRSRIEATEAFVEEILRFVDAHAGELVALERRVDEDAAQRGLTAPTLPLGVEYEMRPLPGPVEILVGAVAKVKNPRSGLDMTVMLPDKVTAVKMLDYGQFAATRTVPTPRAYLFRREPGLRVVCDKMLAHGVAVEELTKTFVTEVESFVLEQVTRASQPAQGHHEVRLAGRVEVKKETFFEGTLLIRSHQPLGMLAAYLLEPESDDGLVTWNVLDAYLEPGKVIPSTSCCVTSMCRRDW